MQTIPGKNENGFDIGSEKRESTTQITAKPKKQRGLRSFIAMSFMFAGIFAAGWLYMGNKSLTPVRGEAADVGQPEAGDVGQPEAGELEAISEKTKLLENKIENLQRLAETCDVQHKPLVMQNQKLAEENKTLIARNKELADRIETLSNQFDKVNEVYLKRLAGMENAKVTPVAESATPLEEKREVVEAKPVITPPVQDLNQDLVNENKVLVAQNADLTRRNEELAEQFDKANKVYLKRLALMENPVDSTALIAKNEELEQKVVCLVDELEQANQVQQELIIQLDNSKGNSMGLVAKNEELEQKVDSLGAQLEEANKFQQELIAKFENSTDDRRNLIAKNEELEQKAASLGAQLEQAKNAQQELIAELENQKADSAAEKPVLAEADVLIEEDETMQGQDQGQTAADINAALIAQNEELAKKVAVLSDQLKKSNKVPRQQLTEGQPPYAKVLAEKGHPEVKNARAAVKNVPLPGQRGTAKSDKVVPKKQEQGPWKGTSVAELLANIKPAAKNR